MLVHLCWVEEPYDKNSSPVCIFDIQVFGHCVIFIIEKLVILCLCMCVLMQEYVCLPADHFCYMGKML